MARSLSPVWTRSASPPTTARPYGGLTRPIRPPNSHRKMQRRHLATTPNFVNLRLIHFLDLAASAIESLVGNGTLYKRASNRGTHSWGPRPSSLSIATASRSTFSPPLKTTGGTTSFCRTGPYASNIRIATAAKQRGWKWHPYGSGFSRARRFLCAQSRQRGGRLQLRWPPLGLRATVGEDMSLLLTSQY